MFFIILYNIIFKANFVVVKYEFIDNETAFLSKRYINVVFDRWLLLCLVILLFGILYLMLFFGTSIELTFFSLIVSTFYIVNNQKNIKKNKAKKIPQKETQNLTRKYESQS